LTKPGTVLKDLLQTAGRKTVAVIETVIDFIATMARKLKNGAVKLFEDFKQFIDDVFKWLEELFGAKPPRNITPEELDWMASRKIGNLGGNILKETQIRKLRGFLKTKGVDLIVEGDAKGITRLFKPVDDFKNSDELFYFMKNKRKVGAFNAETKQFFLTKDATEIVAFHEQMHYFHFEEVGELSYKQLSKLDKEMYVWKQILENRSRWTNAELKDSLRYINDIRTNPKYGLNPLKIN
jgi:Metallopeptidase toxin 4